MVKRVHPDERLLAQIPPARERARLADETEPRARSACYDRRSKRIVIELTNGCLFAFPARCGQGLQTARPAELEDVEVAFGGEALRWESLDVDLGVPGLIAGSFGSGRWISELARQMGRVSSEAKARTSRENGRKGGRPRKTGPTRP